MFQHLKRQNRKATEGLGIERAAVALESTDPRPVHLPALPRLVSATDFTKVYDRK